MKNVGALEPHERHRAPPGDSADVGRTRARHYFFFAFFFFLLTPKICAANDARRPPRPYAFELGRYLGRQKNGGKLDAGFFYGARDERPPLGRRVDGSDHGDPPYFARVQESAQKTQNRKHGNYRKCNDRHLSFFVRK